MSSTTDISNFIEVMEQYISPMPRDSDTLRILAQLVALLAQALILVLRLCKVVKSRDIPTRPLRVEPGGDEDREQTYNEAQLFDMESGINTRER